jgi:DNA-directed RNA polymerase subunit RPC12/RpoP
MPKVKKEFLCTECHKYFDIKLNISLDGNYRVHCPNCGHIHYRAVSKGEITDTRFTDNSKNILIEDLYPMKSSCRDNQEETAKDSLINGDFLQLWKEKFSAYA